MADSEKMEVASAERDKGRKATVLAMQTASQAIGEEQASFAYAVYRGSAVDNRKIKHWDDLPQETRDMMIKMAAVQMGQK